MDDRTGAILTAGLARAGHRVVSRQWVSDDVRRIRAAVRRALARRDIQAVVTNGGTGLTSRDVTVEALVPLLEKRLEGFGELFRFLSYRQVGSAAIMSRALAGSRGGKLIVALPGSPRAADLALKRILLPELPHLIQQLQR